MDTRPNLSSLIKPPPKRIAAFLSAAAAITIGGFLYAKLASVRPTTSSTPRKTTTENDVYGRASTGPNAGESGYRTPPRFVDVARYSGIRFRHYTGTKGIKTILETTGSGCAFCDYDDDGRLDVYLVNGADIWGLLGDSPTQATPRNALYHNDGDGSFTEATEASGAGDAGYGWGCVFGDYDNDGDEDLYVTNFGKNRLYRNNGDGTFTDITDQAGLGDERLGASCAFADYDSDGDLDLYVTNYADYTLDGLQLCKERDVDTCCPPYSYKAQQDIFYRNNGDGTFSDITEEAGVFQKKPGRGLGVAFADYDDDGDLDIYVANDTTKNSLFRNNGDGTLTDVASEVGVAFQESGFADSGMGVDFGDYDNDGRLDLFVANFQDYYNTLYHNEGHMFAEISNLSGLARPSLDYLSFGAAFIDYDNDGWLDIFLANGHVNSNIEQFHDVATYKQKNKLFKNNRDGTFTDVSAVSGSGLNVRKVSRGAAFGDYDDDGDIDILVSNSDDTVSLLRNDLHPPGYRSRRGEASGAPFSASNSLVVEVTGVESNRDAIGARLRINMGESVQVREIRTGASYLSHSDLRAHFGLGSRDVVDELEIRWPSGKVKRIRDVRANQLLIVREDQ